MAKQKLSSLDLYFDNLIKDIQRTQKHEVKNLLEMQCQQSGFASNFNNSLEAALMRNNFSPPERLGKNGSFNGEDTQINRAYSWIQRKYEEMASNANQRNGAIPQKKITSKKIEPQTLLDIWLGDKREFKKIVRKNLQEFVKVDGDKFTWANTKQGYISYLAGFYRTLLENNRIKKNLSAPEAMRVLNRTFNLDVSSSKNFLNDYMSGLNAKYLQPFTNIPVYIPTKKR